MHMMFNNKMHVKVFKNQLKFCWIIKKNINDESHYIGPDEFQFWVRNEENKTYKELASHFEEIDNKWMNDEAW